MPPRHALVLTAGLGTRLQPLTSVRAKPAIPVAGVPMVRRIISWLAANGVTDLVLNLHHLPHTLTAVVGDASDLSAAVRYSWEPTILGSAGGPRRALPLLDADTFFIVNGDTLTEVDMGALAAAHQSSGALVTMALVANREPDRYGGVRLDARQRVIGFTTRGAAAVGSCHFVGVQIVQADAFRGLAEGTPVNSVGAIYDELIARRPGAVAGYVSDVRFHDVGTIQDYWRTSAAWAASAGGGVCATGRRTRIDPSATITQSIIWDEVEIGAGCVLEECIVTDGVRLPAGTRHARQVLVRGAGGGVVASPFEAGG